MSRLPDPQVAWRDADVPASDRFGDVYFSAADGLAETRHVFLDGIGAPEAWAAAPRVTVAELGFGSGLNFLATWQAWRETAPPGGRLHYVSIEGFPMAADDMARALAPFPALAERARALMDVLPPRRPGYHLLRLDGGRVSLLLIHDEVSRALAGLAAQADAWFLDGFAPAKNPDMWTDAVLAAVAARSRPGARLATFTAAGSVRRGLAAAGFAVEKRPGFGAKRDCLAATYQGAPAATRLDPWCRLPEPLRPDGPIAVIGAGIAGAAAARALTDGGAEVRVFDGHGAPGGGASGTSAGVMQPRPLKPTAPESGFYAAAYRHAGRLYGSLGDAWAARDLLVFGRDAADRERYAALEDGETVSPAEASDMAGVSLDEAGVRFPGAGALNTQRTCAALLDGVPGDYGTAIAAVEREGETWQLTDDEGRGHEAAAVVLAGGMASQELSGFAELGLHPNRGQISFLEPTPESGKLRCALTFGGYLTPVQGNGSHVLGGTFDREPDWQDAAWRAVRPADHGRNRDVLTARLPALAAALGAVRDGWTGLRATTPDRMPVLGPVPVAEAYRRVVEGAGEGANPYRPGLYVFAGLGSRGFLTAPLAGEMLASMILGTPLPVPDSAVPKLHPARFLVRALRRGRA